MDEFLITQIKDTIDMFATRIPIFYMKDSDNQCISIMWNVEHNQDSLWEIFESKQCMEKYFDDIKFFFEEEYPNLELGIKIDVVPIIIDDEMYSRIILYYYDKDIYQNTNTVFMV